MGYASLTHRTQVDFETVLGTAVAAAYRLLNLDILPSPTVGNALPDITGRFPTVAVVQPEYTTAELSGIADFDTLTLLFLTMFGDTTPAQQGATAAYKWSWTPGQWAEATTRKALTVEHGDDDAALRFTYGLLQDFGLTFDKKSAGPPKLSGKMIGQAMTVEAAMSATPTDFGGEGLPNAATVYLDAAYDDLGDTALGTVLSANLKLGGFWSPFLRLHQDAVDFDAVEARNPDCSLELTLLTDATGLALLETTMRAAGTSFLKLSSVGTVIASTYYHQLDVSMAGAISAAPTFRHEDSKFVVRFPFKVKYDSDLEYGLMVDLTNALSTV